MWGLGALWVGLAKTSPEALLVIRLAYAFGVIWISVFGNLIKNAIEAALTPALSRLTAGEGARRGGIINLSARENGDFIIVSIKDDGPGISSNDQSKLFEPYFTTKGPRDTGMGLYLSRQIVQAHGGEIKVVSQEGKGTEFIVFLQKAQVLDNQTKSAIHGVQNSLSKVPV